MVFQIISFCATIGKFSNFSIFILSFRSTNIFSSVISGRSVSVIVRQETNCRKETVATTYVLVGMQSMLMGLSVVSLHCKQGSEKNLSGLLTKLDGVAPLITDPQATSFNTLFKKKKFK